MRYYFLISFVHWIPYVVSLPFTHYFHFISCVGMKDFILVSFLWAVKIFPFGYKLVSLVDVTMEYVSCEVGIFYAQICYYCSSV